MNLVSNAAEQAAADERWAKWKADGRAHEVKRVAVVRRVVAAACLGGVLWLLLR